MSAQARQPARNDSYSRDIHKPLYCLLFVLPLLVVFHLYMGMGRSGLLAEHDLGRVLSYFGATAGFLPPLAVLTVLFVQHLVKRDRYDFKLRVFGGMVVESVLWVIPLAAISGLTARVFATAAATAPALRLEYALAGLGAGVYEEFIFRLVFIGLIILLGVDVFGLPKVPVAVFAVIATAILFSLSHLNVPFFSGREEFDAGTFAFRMMAGICLGTIFLLRGFGIAVGTHVVWNVYVYVIPG